MADVVEAEVGTALPGWATRHRFSVEDYHRMAESGVLDGVARVELIEGEIVEMAPVGGPHIGTVMALIDLLAVAVQGRARISVQSPVRLNDSSEPEPDVALLKLRADRYRGKTPPLAKDVLLLIEVADSSLRFDREVKLPLYARHGIPEVWIVDLVERLVEVCRAPDEGGYAEMLRRRAGDVVEPEALPGLRVAVAEVLGS